MNNMYITNYYNTTSHYSCLYVSFYYLFTLLKIHIKTV